MKMDCKIRVIISGYAPGHRKKEDKDASVFEGTE